MKAKKQSSQSMWLLKMKYDKKSGESLRLFTAKQAARDWAKVHLDIEFWQPMGIAGNLVNHTNGQSTLILEIEVVA